MTIIEKYQKNKIRIDGLKKKFDQNYQNKISVNNKRIKVLENEIFNKKNKSDSWYKLKLLKLQNKYENKVKKINDKYDVKQSNDINLKTKELALVKQWYDTSVAIIKKKYELVKEECAWIIDDFNKTTKKTLDDLKDNNTNKIKYLSSKNEFILKKSQEKQLLKQEIANASNDQERANFKMQLRSLDNNLLKQQQYTYAPLQIKLKNNFAHISNSFHESCNKTVEKIKLLKYYKFKDFLKISIFGCPLYLYLIILAIVLGTILLEIFLKIEIVGTDILTGLAFLFVFSMIIGTIFNKIPIWKTYLGGGAIGCFIVAGLFGKTFNIIPNDIIKGVETFFQGNDGGGFLNLYIVILLCSSILTLPRKMVSLSFGKYGLLLLISVAIAGSISFGFGRLMGIETGDVLLRVLAPIFGGGNGAGAVPMSNIAGATGYDRNIYYTQILIIIVIANVFMIVASGILGSTLNKTKLSGNGKIMNKGVFVHKEEVNCKDRHVTISLVLFASIFVLGHTLQKIIQHYTHIGAFANTGIIISQFAWAIVISLILNVSGIIPNEIKQGSAKLSKYFTSEFTLIIMTGIGLNIDFKQLAGNFDVRFIALSIIACCLLLVLPFALAKLFKMFPLESMLTAGSCMGAMGGAGAVACLSASNRMELMPYGQISCRIGGSVILILVSPLYTILSMNVPHV